MRSAFEGFKAFIMRGNVVELAVAIVVGSAFLQVVNALVDGLLTPLIAAIGGQVDLSNLWAFEVNNAVFLPGAVLNALINFLMIAAAVYFVVVLPLNKLAERRARGVEEEPAPASDDVVLLREIRDLLRAQQQR